MFSKPKVPEKEGLHIIIVGCGKVGITLIEQLISEGHDITIIDTNPNKIQEITDIYDVMGIHGSGSSFSIQQEAGIENCDLFIAVTGSDELNLLCCTIASQTSTCSTIARVRTPDYSHEAVYLKEKFGLAMIINPELESADEVTRLLVVPAALEVNSFCRDEAEMIKFKVPEGHHLDGMTIAKLSHTGKFKTLICAVERQGQVFIPNGAFTIQKGDVVSFVAPNKRVKSFMDAIGMKSTKVHHVMIIGGGKVSYYLSERLCAMGMDVKIIESNKDRCEELSLLLPKATIINGDGTDQSLLVEEGIEDTDAFIPLTGIDEENVILTLYAKKVSNAKVITKVNRMNFKDVISELDLGSVIYPRFITAETIVAYVRAKNNSQSSNIETLYHMFDNQAEAIEFNVFKDCSVTGIPFKDLTLKKNLLVAFINRNNKIIIPNGEDCIKSGDSVMIVTTQKGFRNLEDILA